MSKVIVILDDEEFELDVKKDGPVILDVAISEDLDPPYSCRGAVCTTCRAKLLKGKVRMENNFALTDGEIEEGYILTCQSHPETEEVIISYDE